MGMQFFTECKFYDAIKKAHGEVHVKWEVELDHYKRAGAQVNIHIPDQSIQVQIEDENELSHYEIKRCTISMYKGSLEKDFSIILEEIGMFEGKKWRADFQLG